jgi:flagellar protein FliS
MSPTELAYRRTAVEGASGFGLLIALYDTLAGDLRRAAAAQRNNDIQKRCDEINHALLVVGYLEDWVDRESGGELAQKLVAFYATLRCILIEAQAKQSAQMLEEQMGLVLSIRGTWQELELRAASTLLGPQSSELQNYPGIPEVQDHLSASSWSA